MRDSPSPSPSLEEAQMSSNHSSSVSSSPSHTERTAETARTYSPVRSAQVAEGHFGCNKTCERFLRVIITFNFLFPPADPQDNGLSSSHNVLGHSPGVVQGGRDTDVEHSKENKRGHTDRGIYVCIAQVSIGLTDTN